MGGSPLGGAALEVGGREVAVTHPDKIVFPTTAARAPQRPAQEPLVADYSPWA